MEVCADRQAEAAERDGEGNVQRGWTRRVVQPKALVDDVGRESERAHRPRRESPCLHVRDRHGEPDTYSRVSGPEGHGHWNPRWTTGFIHATQPLCNGMTSAVSSSSVPSTF